MLRPTLKDAVFPESATSFFFFFPFHPHFSPPGPRLEPPRCSRLGVSRVAPGLTGRDIPHLGASIEGVTAVAVHVCPSVLVSLSGGDGRDPLRVFTEKHRHLGFERPTWTSGGICFWVWTEQLEQQETVNEPEGK